MFPRNSIELASGRGPDCGQRRRRVERLVAAQLVTNAIPEIRHYAGQGPEHLDRIHQLADIVHNLPAGITGGGERGKEPSGYHTFRWMWETASAEQRAWLISQLDVLGYDYAYLDNAASPSSRKPSAGHDRPRQWTPRPYSSSIHGPPL